MTTMPDECSGLRNTSTPLHHFAQRFLKYASWTVLTGLLLLARGSVELVGTSFAFFGGIAFIVFLGLPLLWLSFVTVPLALIILAISGIDFVWQLIKAILNDGWLWLRSNEERRTEIFLCRPSISDLNGKPGQPEPQQDTLRRMRSAQAAHLPRPYRRSNKRSRRNSHVGWMPMKRAVSPELTRGPCITFPT